MMQRATSPCVFAMALLIALTPTPSEGFTLVPVSGSGLLGRGLRACPAVTHSSAQRAELAATGHERGRRPAQRAAGGLAMAAGESSTTKNLIVGFLAFGFLFGALFPLINNGLRIGTAGQEMSGAATGMRQKELDERLSKVHVTLSWNSAASCCRPCRVRAAPVPHATPRAPLFTCAQWPPALLTPAQVPTFAVTDDKGKPYVAEVDGQNKGFFFLVQEKYN
jgi:hypothetical protein